MQNVVTKRAKASLLFIGVLALKTHREVPVSGERRGVENTIGLSTHRASVLRVAAVCQAGAQPGGVFGVVLTDDRRGR